MQCFKNICRGLSHREIAYIVAEFYLNDKNDNEPLRFGPIKNDLTVDEVYRLEVETFGYPISLHPLQPYRPIVSKRISFARDIPNKLGKHIYLLGMYITRKETQTSANEPMQFLTLEDETDVYECILFPKVFSEFGGVRSEFELSLRVNGRWSHPKDYGDRMEIVRGNMIPAYSTYCTLKDAMIYRDARNIAREDGDEIIITI